MKNLLIQFLQKKTQNTNQWFLTWVYNQTYIVISKSRLNLIYNLMPGWEILRYNYLISISTGPSFVLNQPPIFLKGRNEEGLKRIDTDRKGSAI